MATGKATSLKAFRSTVWEYYERAGRHDLPWRLPNKQGVFDPYHIWISEIMLQQTQVPRVIPKFRAFITTFPGVAALAQAPLAQVVQAWNGLGYNRRAKFLWQAAQLVQQEYAGILPHRREELQKLPGIGPNTAGAIMAYAHNQPAVFIETNIRSVFIYHFFAEQPKVHDADIIPLVAQTMGDNPRQWYWALMDYGTHLKQTSGNAARASAHYAKQSKFAGSRRQIRGQVLRLLGQKPHTAAGLARTITDERLPGVLEDLAREGFIEQRQRHYRLRAHPQPPVGQN